MSIPKRRIAAADWSCLFILAVVTAALRGLTRGDL